MLEGYKTYIVAAVLAMVVFVEVALGFDVPGLVVDDNWLLILLNSAGLGSMRAAVASILRVS